MSTPARSQRRTPSTGHTSIIEAALQGFDPTPYVGQSVPAKMPSMLLMPVPAVEDPNEIDWWFWRLMRLQERPSILWYHQSQNRAVTVEEWERMFEGLMPELVCTTFGIQSLEFFRLPLVTLDCVQGLLRRVHSPSMGCLHHLQHPDRLSDLAGIPPPGPRTTSSSLVLRGKLPFLLHG